MAFLFSLFVLLGIGSGHDYAISKDHSLHTYGPSVKVTADHHFLDSTNNEYLSIDDEDFIGGRKLVLITAAFVAIAQVFIFPHVFNQPKSRLPFFSHLFFLSSNKYILQRVLRI